MVLGVRYAQREQEHTWFELNQASHIGKEMSLQVSRLSKQWNCCMSRSQTTKCAPKGIALKKKQKGP
jgi:hypothetical protein